MEAEIFGIYCFRINFTDQKTGTKLLRKSSSKMKTLLKSRAALCNSQNSIFSYILKHIPDLLIMTGSLIIRFVFLILLNVLHN